VRSIRRAALLVTVLLLAGCGSGTGQEGTGAGAGRAPAPEGFNVFVASYDLAAGTPPGQKRRFIVGLTDVNNRPISYGRVDLRFAWLGDRSTGGNVTAEPSVTAQAEFLPIPGSNPEAGESAKPRVTPPSEARGVYSAQVGFDRPGFWGVEVQAELDGVGRRSGTSQFEVRADTAVPDVGEQAPRTRNLVAGAKGVPAAAVDSRAQGGAKVPDPELHRRTIADAVAAGRPAVVVFATPVYCVSQFCGPITDMVAELAKEYGDRADFIHVEIWRDFQAKRLNDAASQWLLHDGQAQEPWVFVIGADGRITARFDNVATRGELEPLLRRLPRS
jgi:hypothetical protein